MYERRVAKGAVRLDAVYPGWYDKIDLDRLDLSHWQLCVLGQLYGTYHYGVDVLDIEKEREALGFTLYHHACTARERRAVGGRWLMLAEVWKKAILERRAKER